MTENARLFFAVNFSEELKEKIFNELVSEIPKEGFGKVSRENLHITLAFLGYFPEEKIPELQKKASALESFESFEAEINCIGHFNFCIIKRLCKDCQFAQIELQVCRNIKQRNSNPIIARLQVR